MDGSPNSVPLASVLGVTKMTGRRFMAADGSKIGGGETLPDHPAHPLFFFRAQEAAVDAAPHGVEQGQPILERGRGRWLPAVEALFPAEEDPLFADVLGVTLERRALGRGPFPTDFGFGH